MSVSGKVAVVTGGRRGIGQAFAIALKDAGAQVGVIAKSKDRGKLREDINYASVDLSNPIERIDIFYNTWKPDILINNAGVSYLNPALLISRDKWMELFEVNVHAVFDLSCQAVEAGCKRIINIASISSFNGAKNISAYCSTKHALIGLTKCLSNEWASMGVTVNNIAPGFIETDMLQLTDPATVIGRVPIGRIGVPQDVVGAMMFLVSDEASYITGQTIVVDGGYLAR